MELKFEPKRFVGIANLVKNISKEGQKVIMKMLTYNPDERPTAHQLLGMSYFKEFRDKEQAQSFNQTAMSRPAAGGLAQTGISLPPSNTIPAVSTSLFNVSNNDISSRRNSNDNSISEDTGAAGGVGVKNSFQGKKSQKKIEGGIIHKHAPGGAGNERRALPDLKLLVEGPNKTQEVLEMKGELFLI